MTLADLLWYVAGAVTVFAFGAALRWLDRHHRRMPASEATAGFQSIAMECLICGTEMPTGVVECPSCSQDLAELILEHREIRLRRSRSDAPESDAAAPANGVPAMSVAPADPASFA